MTPSSEESLGLLSKNVEDLLVPHVISLSSRMSEIGEVIRELKDKVDHNYQCNKQTAEHSVETRTLLERHIHESASWNLVITKIEAHLADLEFWGRLGKTLASAVARIVAAVAAIVGLFLSAHAALPHLRDWWRGI